MTAKIIDGKLIAADLRARVADEVARVKRDHSLTPGLAVVLVGHEPGISALGVRLTGDPDFAPLTKAQAVRIDGRAVRWRFAHDDVAPRAP